MFTVYFYIFVAKYLSFFKGFLNVKVHFMLQFWMISSEEKESFIGIPYDARRRKTHT